MSFKKEKSWYSKEYPCVVIMSDMGHRCGYVGVPKGHALYKIKYNEETHKLAAYYDLVASKRGVTVGCLMDNIGVIPTLLVMCSNNSMLEPGFLLGVHGGITYSDSDDYPIPMEDYWWFGYGCAHAGDGKDLSVLNPELREIYEEFPVGGEVLRSLEYCFYECIKLADQLRRVDEEYKKRKEILFRKF